MAKSNGVFKFFGVTIFSLIVVGVVASGGYFGMQLLSDSGYFEVKSVQVKGVIKADGSKVEKMVKSLVGKSIFKIKSDSIDRVNDTWVERMEIRKVFPDRLEVVVFEKTPVFTLTNTKGCFTATSSGLMIKEDCKEAKIHMEDGVGEQDFKEFIKIYEDTAYLSKTKIRLSPSYFTVADGNVKIMGNYDREEFARLFEVYKKTVKIRYKSIDYVDMRIPDKIYVKGVM
jgi:cell division protein FtsQ